MQNAQHDESDSQPHKIHSTSTTAHRTDLLCFSHLRWHFVTQRPQHLLTRAAQTRRVFFWEEPYWDADDNGDGTPTLEVMQESPQLFVLRPHLPRAGNADDMQRDLLRRFMQDHHITTYASWYYTPMALGFTDRLTPAATVYDCMDELTGFLGAPPELAQREQDLFPPGRCGLHRRHEPLRSQAQAAPERARLPQLDRRAALCAGADDHSRILPIRQRLPTRAPASSACSMNASTTLWSAKSPLRPAVQFVFLGPIVKIDPAALPQGANIHYLGGKSVRGAARLPRGLGCCAAAVRAE